MISNGKALSSQVAQVEGYLGQMHDQFTHDISTLQDVFTKNANHDKQTAEVMEN